MKNCCPLLVILLFTSLSIGYSQTLKDTIRPANIVSAQLIDSTSNSKSAHNSKISNEVVTIDPKDDFMALDENTIETISVIANDIGIQNGVKSVVIIKNPLHGKVEILPDFSAKYTPDRSYVGLDSIRYKICNTDNECGTAKVDISVLDVNYQPNSINDTISVRYSSNVNIDILSNDIDVYDEPLTITIVTNTENNDCEPNSNNELNYHPHRGFWGLDSLTYQVCDKEGNCSTAIVYINVAEWTFDDLVIPNGMSPNNDGMNDMFEILEFNNFEGKIDIHIFNNWGSVVYKNEAYNNDWDGVANAGTSKGKKVPVGTYYYMITVEGASSKLTGYIYIVY